MHPILQTIDNAIIWYNEYIGGFALLLLLIPTGLYFIIRLRFLNIRRLRHSIRIVAGKFDKKHDVGDVNHFKALTTALSATVGTGNIVGVALAIGWGGPGAIFWMWVTGFLGMILKYAECTLAHKFRSFNSDGSVSGGPMYYMEHGLKHKLGKYAKVLAIVFAVAAVLCSLGTGNMAQSNSMSGALFDTYKIDKYISGVVIALLALLVVVGGIKRIAEVTSRLVPFMAVVYFLAAMLIILIEYDRIPYAFGVIFSDAFTGKAAAGGFFGSAFLMTMLMGVRRGLFSNEAGQGSAAIAHAAAKTEWPAREGLVASLEPLVDTIIICTLTALMIILTGAWELDREGVTMTTHAMEIGLSRVGIVGVGKHIVAGGLMLFAFSTIIAWAYYGSRAVNYLFGEKFIKPYGYLYGLFVFLGSIWGLDLVWHFVDMVITFMTIPNLIALLLLAPVVMSETHKYFKAMDALERPRKTKIR
ncbi:MAG: sodium:alanine symporter family protein [Bacteroidales bacterium]|jgi:AGCS family alanine or glycine:cation symporter|nr:sodium:alanine symporter family protein [Bacteroidales bacterium]MDD3527787.1 sodium:alanine symporter family protein [Bacteroidales bacterium]MDD4176172.1 sodium:alanine symporter family protein [Bacteroidales bacterium]MDD4741917.1 sodium:alanine symporter family protein [Bacteroidales bacterium]MDY0334280.1 sodium:alanine symporter family protein [Bacteroidales bacterium]